MEYRTLWGSVSVAVILRLYPERVETKDAMGFKAWLGPLAKPAETKFEFALNLKTVRALFPSGVVGSFVAVHESANGIFAA
jgi:antibiotic biosynthesis monooxygenase (ABM) superfamily enzyme